MDEQEVVGWLKFKHIGNSETGKTKVWSVHNAESGDKLGDIVWRGNWWCYAFFPLCDSYFEKKCLRDIADFCEDKTNEQRDKK